MTELFTIDLFKIMGGISYINDPYILLDVPYNRDVFWPRKFELMVLNDLKNLLLYTKTKFIKFYRKICRNINTISFLTELEDLVLWNELIIIEDTIYEMYKRVSLCKKDINYNELSGNIRYSLYLPTRYKLMIMCIKISKLISSNNNDYDDFKEGWLLCDDITREIAFDEVIITDGNFYENNNQGIKENNIEENNEVIKENNDIKSTVSKLLNNLVLNIINNNQNTQEE